MADQNDLEIYKQRYETYRHLDRLRWLMLLAAVGVVLLYLLLGGVRYGGIGWLVLGGLLLSLGAAKLRIGLKAAELGEALAAFAQPSENGGNMPETPRQGASFWFGRILAAFGAACFPAALIAYLETAYISPLRASDNVFIWRWDAWAYGALFLMSVGIAKLRIAEPHADISTPNRKSWRYWAALLTALVGCVVFAFLILVLTTELADERPMEDKLIFVAVLLLALAMIVPWLAARRIGYRRLVRSKLLLRFWEEVGGMDAPGGAPFWLAYDLIVAGVVFWAAAAASFLINLQ